VVGGSNPSGRASKQKKATPTLGGLFLFEFPRAVRATHCVPAKDGKGTHPSGRPTTRVSHPSPPSALEATRTRTSTVRAAVRGKVSTSHRRSEMTKGEQRVLMRGVAAGTMIGLAIGLMIALFIAMKPELFAGLFQ
jgi:hypothetical protein